MNLESCIRCGSCKALCPTHIEDATEGMSARGRTILLNKLLSGDIPVTKKLNELINSCILCGACNKLCPLGINITDAVYEGRQVLRKFGDKKRFLSFFPKFIFKNPLIGFKALKFCESIGGTLPIYRLQPFTTLGKLGLKFPDLTLRDGISIFKVLNPKGRIALFAGCSVNFLYPNIGKSLIKTLNAMKYDVILPKGESCCGAPLMGLGLKDDAAELAEKNINIFEKLNVEAVIGLCPTCVHFIKNEYKKLIGEGMVNAMEISSFLKHTHENISPKSSSGAKILYHDPCHSIYSLNTSSEPRQILKSLGAELLEPAEKGCCGFGGTFRLLYPELSEGILEKRLTGYRKSDLIVTSCPNCIIQLRSKIKDKPVKHIIEIIEEAIT